MTLRIEEGGLDDVRVQALLGTHLAKARAATAEGFAFALDLSGLRLAEIRFFSAWDNGTLLGVGLLTRWASAVLLGYVAIGIWKEHARWGFFLNWVGEHGRGNGVEYSVILAGALVCLILAGGGRWSFDGRRAARAESDAMGRARLRNR